jgi:hypothetical protein
MSSITVHQRPSLAEAREAGAVSIRNSKMPGSSFATSSFACHVGGRLAEIPGSVCHACYARRLERFRDNVSKAWGRNLDLAREMIAADPERWAALIAHQINAYAFLTSEPHHRWFDGGDLDSVSMLRAIVRVAELTPAVAHWLPTREVAMVRAFLSSGGVVPPNLIIRISSPMIDDEPLPGWPHTSTVHHARVLGPGEVPCEARTRGNVCGPCRACWSPSVRSVSYPKH